MNTHIIENFKPMETLDGKQVAFVSKERIFGVESYYNGQVKHKKGR